ncbi:MAG: phosphorylase [Bacteroidia bacterium]|nr:phosphorylase [Bacteroidia bacterium]
MNPYSRPTELVINSDGSVYHLKLHPEELADTVIVVGDPERVAQISGYFDRIEITRMNREIVTHTGFLSGKRITVMSTGMGTDNIDIVINELDALVNIDLKNRQIKEHPRKLTIVRLGTSGAMQPEIPVNSFVLSNYALGLDGLLNFYAIQEGILDSVLGDSFRKFVDWDAHLPYVYGVKCAENLLERFNGEDFYRGITATAPGFYGPQGRVMRLGLGFPELNARMQNFSYAGLKITNYEMETSALYGLGGALGHEMLTVCVAIANRVTGDFSPDYHKAVRNLIEIVLEKLTT